MKPKARNFKKEFTIEIIEHYPNKATPAKGTFHAFVEELGMDLRGVYYDASKPTRPWVRLPSKKGILDGKECFYTLYSFCDAKKNSSFIKTLQTAFWKYWKEQQREGTAHILREE